MDRRQFLQHGLAATAAAGSGLAIDGIAAPAPAPAAASAVLAKPVLQPVDETGLHGHTRVCEFREDGIDWTVYEDLRTPQGAISFVSAAGMLALGKRTEAAFPSDQPPYFGMKLAEVALADADLLADHLLRDGDPSEQEVRDAAPPPASLLDPKDHAGRWPWTTFVGTREALDTMPILPNGRSRTWRPEHAFAELGDVPLIKRRHEGLLGGWMPAVHKVLPTSANRHYDLLVFADVRAQDRFIVQTWHRSVLVEDGRATKTIYTHSYPEFPPRRGSATAEDFYRGLLRFAGYWQQLLRDTVQASLPDPSWNDMARFAFARELVVRPGGTYPKYGAVERDYYGNEYDGFQDTFTSSLYANLEWGRFEQAAAVLDGYFNDFVQADGMPNMRGPEVGQFGLILSLMARYLRYTGDAALLRKHRGKIEATAQILEDLHEQSLKLPANAPGHGLIHGWNESDACLFPDPTLWWKPYYANSALAARGLADIAPVWPRIGGTGAAATAKRWHGRAQQLSVQTERTLRANIRHDLKPPYIGPLPGAKLTFRQSLLQESPSEQGWPHRVYAELLQADVLPEDLANLVIDCVRGHGGTSLGVVANIAPPSPESRDLLGFISYGYAQQLLRLDRIEEYLLFLYAHRYHAHTRGGWTAGEVSGITGGMPLFCMPAQLTIPLLLRWMLVFEDSAGEQLHLARAVPREWLASGQEIAIAGAPTRWGKVGLRLRADAQAQRIDGHVDLPAAAPDGIWLSLRLPTGKRLVRAFVDGVEATPGGRRGDALPIAGRPGTRIELQAFYA
ncbi:Tat pathway signal protein [Pseudoxanthomonas wuyuanensis]|uniref:Tat (Twin-arginine translocation) pathway signal sequence n=1 Tax=Pseudoxanthomonas wuyuanensis TaxID=1073196 RepID=A0A286D2V9_9GAMM|nr:Tat pathway signal protein [Pseudoxanthomonas wuyuanensis]KAF1723050.1 Tat pathway signal protein [Pseudoxanthomonas wuyuanensis]SOD52993.1 hypothetical protein SAMN06296416_102184 [Pseudoxanthomonas wuyuanensis]